MGFYNPETGEYTQADKLPEGWDPSKARKIWEGAKVSIVSPTTGEQWSVDSKDLPDVLARGWRPEFSEEQIGKKIEGLEKELYGGVAGKLVGGSQAFLRGVTLGGSDVLTKEIAPETYRLGQLSRKYNPKTALLSEIAGGTAAALATGGAGEVGGLAQFTPAGAASRLGSLAGGSTKAALAARLGTESLLARAAAKALPSVAQGVVEGGAIGLGYAASDIGLADHPMAADAVLAHLGSGLLYGGAAGGAGGLGGAVLAEASNATRRGLSNISKRVGSGMQEAIAEQAAMKADLAALRDVKKALGAEKVLADEQERVAMAAFKENYGAAIKTSKEAAEAAEKKFSEALPELTDQVNTLRNAARQYRGRLEVMADMGLAADEKAARAAIKAMEPVEKAFDDMFPTKQIREKELLANGTTKVHRLQRNPQEFIEKAFRADAAKAQQVISAYEDGALNLARHTSPGVVGPETTIAELFDGSHPSGLANDLAEASKKMDAAVEAARTAEVVNNPALEAIRKNQERISAALDGVNKKLKFNVVKEAEATVKAAEKKGLKLDDPALLLYAADEMGLPIEDIPVIGSPLHMVLKAHAYMRLAGGKGLLGRGGRLGNAASSLAGHAVNKIPGINLIGRFGGKELQNKIAGMVQKNLQRSIYVTDKLLSQAPRAARATPSALSRIVSQIRYNESEVKPKSDSLRDVVAARSAELGATAATVDGVNARRKSLLAGLQMQNPEMASKLDAGAKRRQDFLLSKLPPMPRMGSLGKMDRYQLPDYKVNQLAKYMIYSEHPEMVEEEFARGVVTPEGAETLRAVYPDRFAHLQSLLIKKASEMDKKLDYAQMTQLSLLFNTKLDSTMSPQFTATMQGNFAKQEQQDAQQQQERQKRPGFAKIKAPSPTQAQQITE